MTTRLVGLMSAVLLVSLAAFAYLIGRWQDEVMAQVTQTASRVGQEVVSFLGDPDASPHAVHRSWVQRIGGEGDASILFVDDLCTVEGEAADSAACDEIDGLTWVPEPAGRGEASGRVIVDSRVRSEVTAIRLPETVTEAPRHAVFEVETDDGEGAERAIVLRIVAYGGEETDTAADSAEVRVERVPETAGAPGDPPAPGAAVHRQLEAREFVRRIPTESYAELFASMRRRSLLLFVGVLALGTVLSASAAARFTRPIRQLDTALHRLSSGELDVEVEPRGRDEVARLGHAFNAVTRELRASRERERELSRREKLSALGRLAAGVAHDVRNPLHSIGLTLQHLQETARPVDAGAAAELDRSVGIIRAEIRRLDRLVENFLRFARNDGRERRPTALATLARETLALVEKEAERRGTTVELALDEDAPEVEIDAEAVRSALLNVVLNGFEAMPDGGRLRVAVRGAGDEVRIEVADTGPGIPPEERERVFEFAYTTRDDGSGLGLAMVHHVIVEEHGGRVAIDGEPGEGTRVTLALPRTGA